ncbi:MAG: hypothetical protein EOL98_08485 [Negativicutes bacterium]|nr:hypothetical protein [Negativicutes bacterium]
MDAFSGAIKVFAEKHLIPSIVSLITGTIFYLLTPDDFWVLTKLNKIWYFLLISGCIFVLIQVIVLSFNKMQEIRYGLYNRNRVSSMGKAALEKLWTTIDEFDQEDRKLLIQFIESENEPYTVTGNVHYSSGKLLGSQYVHKIQGYKNDKSKNQTVERFDPLKMMVSSDSYTQYVLIDGFYKVLKLSYEQFGQICHFKEV